MSNPLPSSLTHPLAVPADIRGEAGGPLPIGLGAQIAARVGVDGRQARELRRQLDQGFGDQYCHRVEVGGVSLKAQTLGLEGDRAAAAERVEQRRGIAIGGGQDQLAGCSNHPLIGGRFPLDQGLDEAEQPPAALLRFVERAPVSRQRVGRREVIDLREQLRRDVLLAGIVDQRAEDHRAAGG